MKLAIFGANGSAGTQITQEALSRGHEVTAIVRDLSRFSMTSDRLTVVVGNVCDADSVAAIVQGHDAVINAAGPGAAIANNATLAPMVIDAAKALIEGLTRADVRRLIVVGGAGSLEVAPGVQLVDTPDFPAQYRPASLAHRDSLKIYQASHLDWTFFSPAAEFEPGERIGKFRLGRNQLLVDTEGRSRTSVEDYAIAFVDEVEQPQFVQSQMTIAY
ncbi:MAG: NAD(P)-dependent oxidoreductase [Stenomitos rutilans HA7619-LM2]|jgi:hypothetical protein|nr:NAD(P)-dependent oxidoreductase [Stenomitos rutilans HA7619-LM2]